MIMQSTGINYWIKQYLIIETIFGINVFKKKGISAESDLVRVDQVRVRILKTMNTKSSSPQFSNEVYTVVYTHGNNIKISDGKTYKRYSVLKVVSDAQPVINPKQQAIKNARYIHKELKQIDQENIIPTTRQKRSNAGKAAEKLDM